MNGPTPSPGTGGRDEMMSALFSHLVIHHTNLALLHLGHSPHPETGQRVVDLESARLFIDLLEMIEIKTRGNLVPEEAKALRQSLAAARMAFVEVVNKPPAAAPPQPTAPAAPASPPETAAAPPAAPGSAAPPETATASEDEARRRFTKKY